VELTTHLPSDDRERAEARLRHNLMAWLTTVRPDGQPVTVPVWFLLREDETILVYSKPGSAKLRNIAGRPKVSMALDVCDLGRNIVRLEAVAEVGTTSRQPTRTMLTWPNTPSASRRCSERRSGSRHSSPPR
jgi:PPOX class probable F420-dependent enzyme